MKNQIKLVFLFVFIVFISGIAFSQNRWVKAYYDDQDAIGINISNSYDKGILIVGKHGHNYVNYNWLIKTDVNGEILWKKTIGDADSYITILHIDMNEGGGLFCAGITNYYDEYRDPIIIKLDSCGEKEWCKVFYTPGNMDFSNFVLAMDDGGCVAILRYTGDDPTGQIDRICLAKLSGEGDLIWKQCYNSQDTGLINADARYLTITQDSGFLITAMCNYLDPNHPNLYWAKQYYIKTDSIGNFQWETVVHKDVGGEAGGDAWSTTLNPEGTYYYSSISHYYHNPTSSTPSLLKMDLNGNVVDIYDIVSGYKNGGLAWSKFLNDSVIAGSAGWGNTEDDIVNHAILIDSLGNIINYTDLVQDIYGSILQVTFDGKLVYMYNTYQNSQFDVYLRKLNQNLEDDTIYTYPFQYDTLCPYPIASDTIVQDDCGLIVGMKEVKQEKEEERDRILIYPNPAQNFINIEYPIMNYECRSIISIYDIYGRKVKEIKIPKGQNEVIVNVSKWNRGIYIAVLWQNGKLIAKEKFLIIR